MLNRQPQNTMPLNSGTPPAALFTEQGNFTFNGFPLSNCDRVGVQEIDYDDFGKIDYRTFNHPRIDGGGVLGHYWRRKDIHFKIGLKADTAEGLNTLIDEFKKAMSATEALFEIVVSGEVRKTTASVTSLKFNRKYYQLTFVQDVSMTLSTMRPHFYKEGDDTRNFLDITADLNEELENVGSGKTQPRFYFVFGGSISGLSDIQISMGTQLITINQVINNGDILTVDGENKEVKINATIIDYVGVFPILETGTRPISFKFTPGATFDCDITEIHKREYI